MVYLGLGSNLGDRRAHLEEALREIARAAPLRRVSSFYRSDPVGFKDQPPFWNVVAEILWSSTPEALLRTIKRVERRLGRTPTFRNGPREIDVDILDFGGIVRTRPDPVLPHPRMADRRFALTPLAELSRRWRHPLTGQTAKQMLAKLPRKPGTRKIHPQTFGRGLRRLRSRDRRVEVDCGR